MKLMLVSVSEVCAWSVVKLSVSWFSNIVVKRKRLLIFGAFEWLANWKTEIAHELRYTKQISIFHVVNQNIDIVECGLGFDLIAKFGVLNLWYTPWFTTIYQQEHMELNVPNEWRKWSWNLRGSRTLLHEIFKIVVL